jgi:hypothetical protein
MRLPRGLIVGCALLSGACADEPTAVDTTPPGPIPSLTASVTGGAVRLAWSEPGDRDLAGALVARFPAAGVDGAPEPGRSYAAGDAIGAGQTVFNGAGTSFSETPPCKEHVYAAWARDASGNWSASAQTARVMGLPGSALPAAPTNLSATIDGAGIALSWTLTGPPASVRVVRKRGSAPTSVTDGETIYTGAGTNARDATPELNPQVTGHYAVFACNPCGDCEAAGARTSVTPSLLQALRGGGFVIFWRHATAAVCVDRQDLGPASMPQVQDWWRSCERSCAIATARQLSPQGYGEAQTIGAGLRTKGIGITRVLSSEYCRATETAANMNLGPMIETIKEVTFFVYPELDPCVELQKLAAQPPRSGGNTAIIAHLFTACMDIDFAMGEAYVYRPDGRGGATRIARVKASEWGSLP